ncbi:MAG: TrbI/VirB10 family protein [Bacteriovoracaceae bacterium]|nr:TrbI/VirB10 family protein [Bacteriovoracaceae bacterium]
MNEKEIDRIPWWKCWKYFLKKEGEKTVLDIKRFFYILAILLIITLLALIVFRIIYPEQEDTSRINSMNRPINQEQGKKEETDTKNKNQKSVGGIKEEKPDEKPKKKYQIVKKKINYRAKQVLSTDENNNGRTLPIGINLIGKLLNSIDTRQTGQMVKVLLPYGGKHKGSGGSLPSNTIIFGRPIYSGEGAKVQIKFNRALFPDGEEINFMAQALSPKDYSIGIEGEFHGNTGGRTAAVLGLTMVAGMSETLVKKEALGQGFQVTPKASLKNGFYNGVSKVANMEANRNAKELMDKQEYVTVDAGKSIIVSLTSTYKDKNE